MEKRKGFTSKHLDFMIIDIISMAISLVIAYIIRFKGIFNVYSLGDYKVFGIGLLLSYIFLMLFNSYHSSILKRTALNELFHCIILNIGVLIIVITFLFALKTSATYSRMVIGLFFIIDTILMFIFRTLRKKEIRRGFKKGKNVSNVIIVTYSHKMKDFLRTLNCDNTGYYHCIGVVLLDDDIKKAEDELQDTDNNISIVSKNALLDFVKNNIVNEVFIIANSPENEEITELFLNMGIAVNMSMNTRIGELSNVKLLSMGDYTLLSSSISAGSNGERIIKRIFDIIVGVIGIIFTGLFYLIFAPIIKKQSPGPVFFSQDRVGKNGKIFKMYKFRSMYLDAEERKKDLMDQNEMQGLMFKMEDDPRIFPIGKFIRKTSIDEFPQFWNILKGDMSLVGTRPPTLDEYQQYSPYHLSRLAIKPGLTGMWQTSGRSEITDFEEVVRLDNEYIRNFSLKLDIKIIFKTFGAVMGMRGSV